MANHHHHQSEDLTGSKQDQVVVVMVPLPAHSHLNLLLKLSCLISSYHIPVHYVGSATHNRQAKLRANSLNPLDVAKIHFHDFPTPPFLSPTPNPNSSIKFPAHLLPCFEASLHLRQPVAALLHEISPTARRIVVIHDPLMTSVVQDAASLPNAESYAFHCISAISHFFNQWEAMGKPFQVEAEPEGLPSSVEGCVTSELINFAVPQYDLLKLGSGDIYNSCKLMEGTYIDLLAKEQMTGNKKQWAIAPANLVKIFENKCSDRQHRCLEWLDKQDPKSVIYVSFGTTALVEDEQIKELAFGLEQSKQKFIWVLRNADKGDIFAEEANGIELPQGYEERIEGVGMVVRDWAPQLEILRHPSTGGFMSHCGWNSCMESITMGVPIAAWPMHSDQPRNAMLVTQILRVGLVVREWAHREKLATSSTIKKAVKRLMVSKEGNETRERAEELGRTIRRSTEEDGASRFELDSFIAHITR